MLLEINNVFSRKFQYRKKTHNDLGLVGCPPHYLGEEPHRVLCHALLEFGDLLLKGDDLFYLILW